MPRICHGTGHRHIIRSSTPTKQASTSLPAIMESLILTAVIWPLLFASMSTRMAEESEDKRRAYRSAQAYSATTVSRGASGLANVRICGSETTLLGLALAVTLGPPPHPNKMSPNIARTTNFTYRETMQTSLGWERVCDATLTNQHRARNPGLTPDTRRREAMIRFGRNASFAKTKS